MFRDDKKTEISVLARWFLTSKSWRMKHDFVFDPLGFLLRKAADEPILSSTVNQIALTYFHRLRHLD